MTTSAPTKSTSPLIAGGHLRRRPASDRAVKTLPVEDPGTGRSIGAVPDATPADCMAALDAAERAFPGWAGTPARQRSRVLRRAADLLLDDVDRIARTLSLESGKPLAEAREEVSFAAEYLEWSAEEAVRISGRIDEHPEGGCEFVVRRRPVGPCLIISP